MQRSELLAALDLPNWRLRSRAAVADTAEDVEEAPPGDAFVVDQGVPVDRPNSRNSAPIAAPVVSVAAPSLSAAPSVAVPEGDSWEALESEIAACRACGLCSLRKQTVPGAGDREADWLFVGEGPGPEEDEQGEPFVGQAGHLLDAMLASINLKRGQNVFMANAVKCRLPGNRMPDASEIAACRPFLNRQIALLKPKVIVALGRAGALALLDKDETLSSQRNKLADRQGVPVVVTYHPAYLLRTPLDKFKAWEDLCLARSTHKSLSH